MTVAIGLIIWLIFYGIGEYLSKVWSLQPSTPVAVMIVLTYAISVTAWLPSLRAHGNLAILTSVFAVAGALAGVAIGLVIFKEPISIKQGVGIGLAILALILMF